MSSKETKEIRDACHHWLDSTLGSVSAEEFAVDVCGMDSPDFGDVMGLIDEYGIRGNGELDGLAMEIENIVC